MTQHLTTIVEEASASLAAWRLRESARETKAAARQAKQAGAAPEATTPAAGEQAVVGSKEANALLMAMAAWGSREGVEFMLERGGDLCARNDERMTPALAAISRGNAELAMWMIERPEYQWVGDRYPAGGVQTELRAAISASSLHPQMLDFAKSVAKMRPALWSEPKTRKDRFGKACNEDESLVLKTLAENPKAAAWVIGERPLAAKSILEAAMENNSSYPHSGDFSNQALIRAINNGDEASANALLEYARPLIETPWGSGRGSELRGGALIAHLLQNDDAAALAWFFAKAPKLAAEALDKTQGQGRPWSYGLSTKSSLKIDALIHELDMGSRGQKGQEKKRGSLAIWAAHEKADACLEIILGMPSFRAQVASMQSTPEFGWVDVFLIAEPKRVEALADAGFDFAKQAPDDWGYAAIGLCIGSPSIKWLEMIGKRFSGLLGPRASDGKTAFELAEEFLQGKRSGSSGEGSAAKVGKWAAICEKAAMRTGAGRGKSTKEIKQAKSARRL